MPHRPLSDRHMTDDLWLYIEWRVLDTTTVTNYTRIFDQREPKYELCGIKLTFVEFVKESYGQSWRGTYR